MVEGYRIAHWGFGAAGALAIVVSFQLYSTVSGVALVALTNADTAPPTRIYHHEITVAAGWNFYAFAVPGDTSGTWNITGSQGLVMNIFVAGKLASPGSTLDAWTGTQSIQTTNSGNLLGSNNNLTVLTGVYIAAGTQLPVASDLPRLMRQFDETLHLCKRYYRLSGYYGQGPNVGVIDFQPVSTPALAGARIRTTITLDPEMRAFPTAAFWDNVGTSSKFSTISDDTIVNGVTPSTTLIATTPSSLFFVSIQGPVLFGYSLDARL